jgi:hypothetical protein
MGLKDINVALTDGQLLKLANGKRIVLKHEQVGTGCHCLKLKTRKHTRLTKHKAQEKGMRLDLDDEELKGSGLVGGSENTNELMKLLTTIKSFSPENMYKEFVDNFKKITEIFANEFKKSSNETYREFGQLLDETKNELYTGLPDIETAIKDFLRESIQKLYDIFANSPEGKVGGAVGFYDWLISYIRTKLLEFFYWIADQIYKGKLGILIEKYLKKWWVKAAGRKKWSKKLTTVLGIQMIPVLKYILVFAVVLAFFMILVRVLLPEEFRREMRRAQYNKFKDAIYRSLNPRNSEEKQTAEAFSKGVVEAIFGDHNSLIMVAIGAGTKTKTPTIKTMSSWKEHFGQGMRGKKFASRAEANEHMKKLSDEWKEKKGMGVNGPAHLAPPGFECAPNSIFMKDNVAHCTYVRKGRKGPLVGGSSEILLSPGLSATAPKIVTGPKSRKSKK